MGNNKSETNHAYFTPQKLGIKERDQPFIKLTVFIWILTVVAQLGSLAYSTSSNDQEFGAVVFQSIIYLSLITLPLSGLGIWLGRKIGLGAPLLSALLHYQSGIIKTILHEIKRPLLLGIIMGGAMLILRIAAAPYLPPEIPTYGHRGVIGGILVSIGAAVGEEVWFRLGLMSILLWVVTRIAGHKSIRTSTAWLVIIFVAVIFAAVHLPQLMSYGAGSPFAIWATIFGNSLVGIFFGWCYWRQSLIAAIAAHFSVDFVIHVLPAFFI